jgi:hypothetical protein
MRRTYIFIISDLARLRGRSLCRYLACLGGSRDFLQNTADILCQNLGALGVYAHVLTGRLVFIRHCWREQGQKRLATLP